MKEPFDAIIVGAGMAGCAAAIRMAKEGAHVLLAERAEEPGSKNLSGGVLWGHELERLIPGWWREAPVERHIVQKRLSFLTEKSATSIDFRSAEWDQEPYNGFSVLRARFDRWLAKRAEEAGAVLVSGVPVQKLARKDGRVVGVVESGEVTKAKMVILADGMNSRVGIASGILGPPPERIGDVALGVKEVFVLDPQRVEDRFGLTATSGFDAECVMGFLPHGIMAGGFIYTNRESVSLGVVINMASLRSGVLESYRKSGAGSALKAVQNGAGDGLHAYEIIERFRTHPCIAPLIEGGRLVEYGAHLVPEGGLRAVPQLYGDGFMVAGDAAGFCFSNGMAIEGMNLAILSGILAGETALEALERDDFSAMELSGYGDRLEESKVMRTLRKFDDIEKVTWNPRMYTSYPKLMEGVLMDMMSETGEPKEHLRSVLLRHMRAAGIGPVELIKDGITGGFSY